MCTMWCWECAGAGQQIQVPVVERNSSPVFQLRKLSTIIPSNSFQEQSYNNCVWERQMLTKKMARRKHHFKIDLELWEKLLAKKFLFWTLMQWNEWKIQLPGTMFCMYTCCEVATQKYHVTFFLIPYHLSELEKMGEIGCYFVILFIWRTFVSNRNVMIFHSLNTSGRPESEIEVEEVSYLES